MYWAVRQICMAKHLRSRGWWGGWFTGQGENVHNGWLSLQHYRFTYTLIQLLPGLIDHRTFLFLAPEPGAGTFFFSSSSSCTNDTTCCFHSFLHHSSCPRFTAGALRKKSEGTFRGGWGGWRWWWWGCWLLEKTVMGHHCEDGHLQDRIHWE